MAVREYFSTDASAPTLTGQAGSLVNLLKKCLVDGYGSRTALGWTGMYSSDYKKAGFQAPAGSTGMWLYVDDYGTALTSTTKQAAVWGNEAFTGFDGSGNPTGMTNRFPNTTQRAKGCCWWKSSTADGTARPWWLIGDEKLFYLGVDYSTNGYWYSNYFFGDIISYRANDAYHCVISTDNGENATYNYFGYLDGALSAPSATYGKYVARDYTNLVLSPLIGWSGDVYFGTYMGYAAAYPYPNGADNSLVVCGPPTVHEPGQILRGRMPGLYYPGHQRPLTHGVTVSGIQGLEGRTLRYLSMCAGSSVQGAVLFDVTGPWR